MAARPNPDEPAGRLAALFQPRGSGANGRTVAGRPRRPRARAPVGRKSRGDRRPRAVAAHGRRTAGRCRRAPHRRAGDHARHHGARIDLQRLHGRRRPAQPGGGRRRAGRLPRRARTGGARLPAPARPRTPAAASEHRAPTHPAARKALGPGHDGRRYRPPAQQPAGRRGQHGSTGRARGRGPGARASCWPRSAARAKTVAASCGACSSFPRCPVSRAGPPTWRR